MSNTLKMSWTNESATTFKLVITKVKHGDIPTATTDTLSAATASSPPVYGASTVSAKQSNNLSPGPEGSYQWQSTTNPSDTVDCDYHFPAGSSGQLIQLTLNPSKGLEVSFDGTAWSSSKLQTSATSTSTSFTQNCYMKSS